MKSFLLEYVMNIATEYDKKSFTNNELLCKYSKYLEPCDLRHLNFTLSLGGSGSAGSFYKAVYMGKYYKLSYVIGDNKFGYESVNEVLASRLAELLGYDCVVYDLVYAKIKLNSKEYVTWLCVSDSFKHKGDNRTTLEFQMKYNNLIDGYDCCKLLGLVDEVNKMLVLDYIIDNRDRHAANVELIYNNGKLRLAPIFDCGSSLLSPRQYNVDNFNYLHEGPVNNCLISIMWGDVLDVLKGQVKVPTVNFDDLFVEDLYYALDKSIADKEVDMIKCRYDYARRVLND